MRRRNYAQKSDRCDDSFILRRVFHVALADWQREANTTRFCAEREATKMKINKRKLHIDIKKHRSDVLTN